METKPESPQASPTPTSQSALEEYIHSLKTSGRSESDILEVLITCYEEPTEEVAQISTDDALDF